MLVPMDVPTRASILQVKLLAFADICTWAVRGRRLRALSNPIHTQPAAARDF